MATIPARLRTRRGTAAQWISANPILGLGEQGWETDSVPPQGKVGDGVTAWLTLPYTLGRGSLDTTAVNTLITNARPTIFTGVKKMLDDGKSVAIGHITDSTGNDSSTEHIALVCDRLHALYPSNRIEFAGYDNGAPNDYTGTLRVIKYAGASERKVSFVGTINSDMYYSATAANTWAAGDDLDVRIKCAATNWTSATGRCMVGKFNAGGQRSWYLWQDNNSVQLSYTTDGSTSITAACANSNFTFVNGTATWIRAVLDVDNGASGRDVKFYQSTDDGVTWVQKGSTVTVATAITLFSDAVTNYEIGGRGNGGANNWIGDIYRVEIRKGINGNIVCPTLPDLWTPNTSAYDGVFSGAPIIQIWAGAASGWGINNFITNANQMLPAAGQSIQMISTSHNDGNIVDAPYWARWDTLITTIRARMPLAAIAVYNQNPETTPKAAAAIAAHATRCRQMQTFASSRAIEFTDVYQVFLDAVASGTAISTLVNTGDGIHPTNAGSVVWANAILDRWHIL